MFICICVCCVLHWEGKDSLLPARAGERLMKQSLDKLIIFCAASWLLHNCHNKKQIMLHFLRRRKTSGDFQVILLPHHMAHSFQPNQPKVCFSSLYMHSQTFNSPQVLPSGGAKLTLHPKCNLEVLYVSKFKYRLKIKLLYCL